MASSSEGSGDALPPAPFPDVLSPQDTRVPFLLSRSGFFPDNISGSYVLRFVNYTQRTLLATGSKVLSDRFEVGGRLWRLAFYPSGFSSEEREHISIFLQMDNDDPLDDKTEVSVRVTFTLLDQYENPVPAHVYTTGICTYCEGDNRTSYGFKKFITQLELRRHLTDDSFIIKADLIISGVLLRSDTIPVPYCEVHHGFEDLWVGKIGCDVEFTVGTETIGAHRFVLGVRSRVFKAMLCGAMTEGTSSDPVVIEDIEPAVFNLMLHFIYTDALPMSQTLPDMDLEEQSALLQHLLVAADRFDVENLRDICEEMLCHLVTKTSVVTLLTLADQHYFKNLKAECILFLTNQDVVEEVMESEDWLFLTNSCPDIMDELLI